jgi:hypothetical protein
MGSVSSVNPGLAGLLQTLTNLDSPVMTSPTVVSALEKASPTDIVQLSAAAAQLQDVDAIFGFSNGSNADTNDPLASLESLLDGSGTAAVPGAATNAPASSSATPTASSADQMASYQASLQSEETQALFGTGATGSLSDSLFNVIG